MRLGEAPWALLNLTGPCCTHPVAEHTHAGCDHRDPAARTRCRCRATFDMAQAAAGAVVAS